MFLYIQKCFWNCVVEREFLECCFQKTFVFSDRKYNLPTLTCAEASMTPIDRAVPSTNSPCSFSVMIPVGLDFYWSNSLYRQMSCTFGEKLRMGHTTVQQKFWFCEQPIWKCLIFKPRFEIFVGNSRFKLDISSVERTKIPSPFRPATSYFLGVPPVLSAPVTICVISQTSLSRVPLRCIIFNTLEISVLSSWLWKYSCSSFHRYSGFVQNTKFQILHSEWHPKPLEERCDVVYEWFEWEHLIFSRQN